MKYICIENKGEVDLRAFYVMGMGTKSTDDDTIGQFGTGSKYGLTAILRNGNKIFIYSGKKKIHLFSKEVNFRDMEFKQVCIKVGKKTIESSITEEMGKINWNLDRGMKEIVSNAIDEGEFRIFETDRLSGASGKTRVFVSVDEFTKKFLNEFDNHFTFRREPIHEGSRVKLFRKLDDETRIYRRGVSVFSSDEYCSAFDYDFKDIDVQEDRTSSLYGVKNQLGSVINYLTRDIQSIIFDEIIKHGEGCVEGLATLDYRTPSDEWAEIIGDKLILSQYEAQFYADRIMSYEKIVLPDSWHTFLSKNGNIKTVESTLDERYLKGWEEKDVGEYENEIIDDVIKFIQVLGYKIESSQIVVANNKSKDAPLGQFIEDKYYVNQSAFRSGFDEVLSTVVEEMFHAMSHAADETRLFQQFIFDELLYNMKKLKVFLDKKDFEYVS